MNGREEVGEVVPVDRQLREQTSATAESASPTGSTRRTPMRVTSACETAEKMMIVSVSPM